MNRDVCGICWALYDEDGLCECPQVKGKRMTTLREAAQKTLEVLEDLNSRLHLLDCYRAFDTEVATLRAALEQEPPRREWRGMTEAEINEISDRIERSDFFDAVVPFAHAIEAALKEKNQ